MCESRSNEMLSNRLSCETFKSRLSVVKSNNCVINIEYLLQEEKIVLEVFQSSIDSNCVLKRNIILSESNHSNDIKRLISSLSHIPFDAMKENKITQTGAEDIFSPKKTFHTTNKRVAFENPEKDENFGVSGFKFPEPKPISNTKNNFCALNFDGTKSQKRRKSTNSNKHNLKHVKHVKSDTNLSQTTAKQRIEFDNGETKKKCDVECEEKKIQDRIQKKQNSSIENRHKKHIIEDTKNITECFNNNEAKFEIVLSPRGQINHKKNQEMREETVDIRRQKPRKIIVKSNTLELLKKPVMRNAEQQTDISNVPQSHYSSLKELYAKSFFNSTKSFKSMDSGDGNLEEPYLQIPPVHEKQTKQHKRKHFNLAVFPCTEIQSYMPEYDLKPISKRPTIPRRRINTTDDNIDTKIEDKLDKQEIKLPPSIPRKLVTSVQNTSNTTHLIEDNLELRNKDFNLLKSHIAKWVINNKKQKPANNNECDKEIDELCGLITSLLHNNLNEPITKPESVKMKENSIPTTEKQPKEIDNKTKDVIIKKVQPNPFIIKNKTRVRSTSPKLKISHNHANSVTISEVSTACLESEKRFKKPVQKLNSQKQTSNISNLHHECNQRNLNKNEDQENEHSSNVEKAEIKSIHLQTANMVVANANQISDNENKLENIATVVENVIQKKVQEKLNNNQSIPLNKNCLAKNLVKKKAVLGDHNRVPEQRELNALVFKKCMASSVLKHKNISSSIHSTDTLKSQSDRNKCYGSISNNEKNAESTIIPKRRNVCSTLKRMNTAPSKTDLFKCANKLVSGNSLDTYVCKDPEISKVKDLSLHLSKSDIINQHNSKEQYKSKARYPRSPQKPGSIYNSTFLSTKVNREHLKIKEQERNESQHNADLRYSQQTKRNPKPKLKSKIPFYPTQEARNYDYQLPRNKPTSNRLKTMHNEFTNAPNYYVREHDPEKIIKSILSLSINKEVTELSPRDFRPQASSGFGKSSNTLSSKSSTETHPSLKSYSLIGTTPEIYTATSSPTKSPQKSDTPKENQNKDENKNEKLPASPKSNKQNPMQDTPKQNQNKDENKMDKLPASLNSKKQNPMQNTPKENQNKKDKLPASTNLNKQNPMQNTPKQNQNKDENKKDKLPASPNSNKQNQMQNTPKQNQNKDENKKDKLPTSPNSKKQNPMQNTPKQNQNKDENKKDKLPTSPNSKKQDPKQNTPKQNQNKDENKKVKFPSSPNSKENPKQPSKPETKEALLEELKTACCSLCCKTKPNVISDTGFKNTAPNISETKESCPDNTPAAANAKQPQSILRSHSKSDKKGHAEKKALKNSDSDGIEYVYWPCQAVTDYGNNLEKSQSKSDVQDEDVLKQETDDTVSFQSVFSSDLNHLSRNNSDSTDSFKSSTIYDENSKDESKKSVTFEEVPNAEILSEIESDDKSLTTTNSNLSLRKKTSKLFKTSFKSNINKLFRKKDK